MSIACKARQSAFKKNQEIILRNLSVTSDLTKRLRDVELISDSMVADIHKPPAETNRDKASLLLSFLAMKVGYSGNFELFCDALEFGGHQILAAYLRGEVIELTIALQQHVNSKNKQPTTLKTSTMPTKIDATAAYAKAVAVVNGQSGFRKSEESDLVVVVRNLKQEVANKTNEMQKMAGNLQQEVSRARDSYTQAQVARAEVALCKERADLYLAQQSRAAEARENQIRRLEERVGRLDQTVTELNRRIAYGLHPELIETEEVKQNRGDEKNGQVEDGAAAAEVDMFEREEESESSALLLSRHVDELLERLRQSEGGRADLVRKLDGEKTGILELLGNRFAGKSLMEAVQDHLEEVESEKRDFHRKTKLLLDCLTEKQPSIGGANLPQADSYEAWTLILSSLVDLKKSVEDRDSQLASMRKQLDSTLRDLAKLRVNQTLVTAAASRRTSDLNRATGGGIITTPTSFPSPSSSPGFTPVTLSTHSITISSKAVPSSHHQSSGGSIYPASGGGGLVRQTTGQRYGSLQPIHPTAGLGGQSPQQWILPSSKRNSPRVPAGLTGNSPTGLTGPPRSRTELKVQEFQFYPKH